MQLCRLFLEHYDIGGPEYQTLDEVDFTTLDDYISNFDSVQVETPEDFKEISLSEDNFGHCPAYADFVEALENSKQVIIYGESGGTSFDAIVQFILDV